jgi:hypothetical protein
MKTLIILLFSVTAYGQSRICLSDYDTTGLYYVDSILPLSTSGYATTVPGYVSPGWIKGWEETKWTEHVEVLSEPDYTLGICGHDWVFENEWRISTCAVLHGPCGCEREWPDRKQICKQCGLHLRVYKTCGTVKDTRETYEDVVKRFK